MDRRTMVSRMMAAGAAMGMGRVSVAGEDAKLVSIAQFSDAGARGEVVKLAKVMKPEAEWKRQLGAGSFQVTRHEGTERPFTGATWNNHAKGLYRCICCDTALFSSETKFESGTGWPSFCT